MNMGLRAVPSFDELELGRRRLGAVAEFAEKLRPRRGIDAEAVAEEMLRHFPHGDAELVRRAYQFADQAHRGQRRATGGAFIEHPANTAYLLAQLGMDPAAIAAGLLHDVPEDTPKTLDDVRTNFGEEVARLVDGVTKLSRFSGVGAEAQQAENIRKMFLAMADDLRVVVIKLCDRLHNMRTLHALPEEKQRRIARQTLEIYAPLAHRLGIWQVKWELEDLAFKHLEPDRYKDLAASLASQRGERERRVKEAMETLKRDLAKAGIRAELSGRAKHIYSIWQKMQRKTVDLDEVYDLLAVRVIVGEDRDCYAALGVIHSLWPPIPGQFDDYIARPKSNLYQSLHTAVMGPGGHPLEIQVRTRKMHEVAEMGIAAHYRYKEGGKTDPQYEQKLAWVRQLMEWQREVADAQEFVEGLKLDIFQDQVFVFTPKGEVKELTAGSSPIDFAYRIHTDIGHRCIGAKVNGRLVPLDYRLRSGDIVEILTSKSTRGPSRDWLNMVRTPGAREKIRQWFKRQQREENVTHGKELLERELKRVAQKSVGDLPEGRLEQIARDLNFVDADGLFAAVGYGAVTTPHIVSKLGVTDDTELQIPEVAPPAPPLVGAGVRVKGVANLLVQFGACCSPVPGEPIAGYITRGRGVTVHRTDCANVRGLKEPERLVEVEWEERSVRQYPVAIRVLAWDRGGLLRDVANVMADNHVNLISVAAVANADRTATITATLQVTSVEQLSRVMHKLEGVRDVFEVSRDGR